MRERDGKPAMTPEDRIERLERAVRFLASELDNSTTWQSIATREVRSILDAPPVEPTDALK